MKPMHDKCQGTAFFSDHKRATSTYIRDKRTNSIWSNAMIAET